MFLVRANKTVGIIVNRRRRAILSSLRKTL